MKASPPSLRLRLLGAVTAELNGERLEGLDAPRVQLLLARLSVSDDAPLDRGRLAYELWPDTNDSQARTNLRHLLHQLRSGLQHGDELIEATGQTIRWRPGSVVSDVAAFAKATEGGDFEGAVGCYGGDLLPGSYDEWALAERDRLRALAVEARRVLAEESAANGDHAASAEHARELIRLDALSEPGYLLLMEAHARRGHRAEALRVYHACRQVLERELGVEPGEGLQLAYERIRSDQPSAASSAPIPTTSPFVGRDVEFETAWSSWEAGSAGDAPMLLVSGEAGIGKTRLVEELARACAAAGAMVVRARGYQATGRLPWAPIVEWLRSPPIRERIGDLPEVWRIELARLMPELIEAHPNLPRPAPVADEAQRRLLLDAVTRALRWGDEPRLLVLDDLQWCDADTVEAVGYLLHGGGGAPLLVAGTVRVEEAADNEPLVMLRTELGHQQRIVDLLLNPLDSDATAELAQRLSGRKLDEATLAQIYSNTDGNPLFVIETLRAGVGNDGVRTLTPTVRSVIQQRLAQLSPSARQMADMAAVVGTRFSLDLLAAASGVSEESLVADLDELWLRRIVRELGFGYDFSHDRIREVVADAIPPARRRQLHRAVADGLAELAGGQIGSVSSRLAIHYEEAGLVAAAVEAHQRAADHALQLYSLGDAMMSLFSALALLEHLPPGDGRDRIELDLRTTLAVAVAASVGYASQPAEQQYQRAADLSVKLSLPVSSPVIRGLGLNAVVTSRFRRADSLAKELLQRKDEPIAVTEGHYLLGVSAFWQGDLTGARRSLQDAIDSYRPELGPEHLARYAQDPKAICLVRLAATEWWSGELGNARDLAEEARRFADSLDHPNTLGYVLNWIGLLAVEADDRDRLSDLVDDLETLLSSHQLWYPQTGQRLYQGLLDVMDGNRSGVDGVRASVAGWLSDKGISHLSYNLCMLARSGLLTENLEVSRAAVAQAKLRSAEHGEDFMEPELWRLDGEIAARDGDIEQASASFVSGVEVARRQGAVWLELRLAESIDRLGNDPASRGDLAAVLARIDRSVDVPYVDRVAALLG